MLMGQRVLRVGKKGDTVAVIVQEVSKWLEGMITAVEKAAAGGTGTGNSKIGEVASGAAAGAGAKADETSVKGIALGIKEIVDAAGKAGGEKAGGEKAGDVLKDVKEATDKGNEAAGKLFATNAGDQADTADIGKASAAVGAVSGKQIIKAIVDAAKAGEHAGARAGAATNPIAAAIGEANQNGAAFVDDNMKKDDKIAAAIVLRGLAKDGKFAATDDNGAKSAKDGKKGDTVAVIVQEVSKWLEEMIKAVEKAADGGTGGNSKIGDVASGAAAGAGGNETSVKEIALGIKEIVDAAGKAGGEKAGDEKDGGALKGVTEATDKGNEAAGKLFDTNAGGDQRADADAIGKASAAVGAVSGKQIIKAIVDAAGKDGEHAGANAGAAKNPIAAAIGQANQNGAAFVNDMNKDDKIAAAIVLRGLAKDGKFAATDANGAKSAKGGKKGDTVAVIVQEVSKWLEGMITAVEKAAAGGTGTENSKIGDVANNAAGAKADETSVKEIALGIKEIVDAAGKAGGEKAGGEKAGDALKGVKEANGNSNADAGKLFATQGGGQADTADIGKASAAVGAVSGKQIIKAIVDAAGKDGEHAGANAGDAKNPIAAAIGEAGQNGAAFGIDMKKDDKIAAAIVLRGLAKDGKFAATDADGAKSAKDGKKGDTVAVIVQEVSKWLEGMITAVEKAAAGGTGTGDSKIGEVANNGAGAKADDASVKGIALGIKEIVDAAGKAGGEKDGGEKAGGVLKDVTEATDKGNEAAGKLFDTQGGGQQAGAADIGKASAAVGAVSGKQIIKAIVDAAGKDGEHAGKKADDATNPIAAAIGEADQNGAAFVDDMKKDDKIAAAIVLRGLAKDGKFAAADEDGAKSAKGGKKGDTVAVIVQEVSKWLEGMIKAVEKAAAGGTGTENSKIGEVATNGAGAGAGAGGNETSVKEIALGIKEIVDAAGKAGGEKAGGVLKDVTEATGKDNADAGKLFATNANQQAGAADIGKASAAVGAVSGKQIIKAIVDAAGKADEHAGARAGAAKNPIAAAIGQAGQNGAAFGIDNMKKDDKIAAAIVLRGLAKDGKFAADGEDGAKSAKGGKKGDTVAVIVQEVSKWLEEMIKAVEKAADGGTGGNSKIGDVASAAGAGAKADETSVKGIALGIKEIVDAAGKAGEHEGKKADTAKNPIAAAIGQADQDGAAFGNDMNKDDKIAAAIVLRGLAKDGKFAADGEDGAKSAKGGKKGDTVAVIVQEVSKWLEEMIKAVEKAADGGTGGNSKIGDVASAAGAGAKADETSVKGIALGIKEIVDAAGKAGEHEGKKADTAKNPIAAAIGQADQDGAAFGNDMNKDDKIAAAIVLRGLAKDGKFAADGEDGAKSAKDGKKGDTVAVIVQEVSKWLEGMITAVEKAAAGGTGTGDSKIGEVANNGAGAKADETSVKEIALGIKEIVDAAGKAGGEKAGDALKGVTEANGNSNEAAGKLFDTNASGNQRADADAIGKASAAVGAVSGKQIIKAIVDAAGKDAGGEHAGKKAGENLLW